jgi:hypothetical protein
MKRHLSHDGGDEMNYVQHLNALHPDDLLSAVDEKVADTCHQILESDEFEHAANRTNAVGWAIEKYEVLDVEFRDDECFVGLTYTACGDQLEDALFAGDRIDGEAEAVIDQYGNICYQEVTTEVSDRFAWENE